MCLVRSRMNLLTVLHCVSALPRQLQEPQHGGDHAPQLRETRAASRLTRDHGSRDGAQLWLTGRNSVLKHVPPAVSHVNMAHEMGHNFGSPVGTM